jgi:hypothetical protein
MKTLWCRFHFDGRTYRQSTGCRDVRNAEAVARRIRAEIEAGLRGIAPPKRLKVEDALKKFVRSLASGRGGAAQQKTVEKIVRQVLAAEPVRFVDELHVGIYDAWVEKARRPRPKKPNGLAKWTIHMPDSYVIHLPHFLDGAGNLPDGLPGPAATSAILCGAVVAWVSSSGGDLTNAVCRQSRARPHRQDSAVQSMGPRLSMGCRGRAEKPRCAWLR